MKREVKKAVKGYNTIDGNGVHLVRVLGNKTYDDFDPILMLDSFDTKNYDDYKGGFPLHPHRGIETISYIYQGAMEHGDSLGNKDMISDGEVQWMCAGSGIMHEEILPKSDRMLGVQLWLNLPKNNKMTTPNYKAIKNSEIKEIDIKGGKIRLLAGKFESQSGYLSKYLPLDYYDIHLKSGESFSLDVENNASIMLFTLIGEIEISNQIYTEKTAIKLSNGNKVEFSAKTDTQVLFISSIRLDEQIAWGGPIVMNTKEELYEAFRDLDNNTFVKEKIEGF
ncbi:pirin family protein [Campylobacter sputorum]|uniref:pirin family protein n=1 Tax=Campylobacter sputorum TaxID=206 RepID=UPI000B794783|nr:MULTISPECIES: pirin family protein [Campylobacter]ASM37860.1 pirin family protein [Campylobacter sputorum bv. paraureolyticus LMG 11764]MBE7358422.1 pirin family protein [Campylobacter sp. RM11302]MDY6119834.1 pirin family protein [Campylobacter sputorum]